MELLYVQDLTERVTDWSINCLPAMFSLGTRPSSEHSTASTGTARRRIWCSMRRVVSTARLGEAVKGMGCYLGCLLASVRGRNKVSRLTVRMGAHLEISCFWAVS